MEHLKIPATAAAIILLVVVGSFCIFKPAAVQNWLQKQHNSSNTFAQNLPFQKVIFKKWYPAYLRFMGVFSWIFALIFAYAVYLTLTKR